jgi:protein TonB
MKGILGRLLAVLALHIGLLYLVMQANPDLGKKLTPLVVSLIAPPEPLPQAPPPPLPRPQVETVVQRDAPPIPMASVPAVELMPNAITIEVPPSRPALPSLKPPQPVVEAVITAPPMAPSPVAPPRFDAAYLKNPSPAYPSMARRRGEQGRVYLRVYVSSEGSALRVEVRTSSASTLLDQAAKDAVERWRFVPAKQGDQPVEAWVVVPIVFTLEG